MHKSQLLVRVGSFKPFTSYKGSASDHVQLHATETLQRRRLDFPTRAGMPKGLKTTATPWRIASATGTERFIQKGERGAHVGMIHRLDGLFIFFIK